MKLTFWGADHEVTGSCHCIEVNGKRLLIDCGLAQGQDEKEDNQLPFSPAQIDYVLVTHAHIDHSGRLPLLVKNGYHGPIYATRATCELLGIMLRDSAHIQEMDAQWKQRKRKRAGEEDVLPLYTALDVEDTLPLLRPCSYGQEISVGPGITAKFIDAGHLLGSASILLTLSENGAVKTVAFSGDIGNRHQPIIRDPQYIDKADYVLVESTYGNRLHGANAGSIQELAEIFDNTLRRGGNVVIPAFAVGRTQELLYHIRKIKEQNLVTSIPDFPVFVDSPLALAATQIYDGDLTGYADEETLEVLRKGFRPIKFSNLNLCQSADESIALNADPTPKVIISSSGMCDAGRIRHHLKHNLWRSECSVVFVGYQANGTLGRILVDGAQQIKLFGEQIAVKAEIYNFRGLSAHADRDGLLDWVSHYKNKPEKIFVVHGEEEACESFTQLLNASGYHAVAPYYKAEYNLLTGRFETEGIPLWELQERTAQKRKASPAYLRLVAMGERIQEVIRHNEGGATKDLARFADQLKSLIDKWDR